MAVMTPHDTLHGREKPCAPREIFEIRSALAAEALERIGEIYRIEQDIREMEANERQRRRRQDSRPRLQALHAWMLQHRAQPAKADATARVIDYTLGRWAAGRVRHGRGRAHRQQRCRARGAAAGLGTLELAVRGLAPSRRARRGADEPDRIGQAVWPRPLGLPQGRADPAADLAKQPTAGTAPAPLGCADRDLHGGVRLTGKHAARTIVKTGSLRDRRMRPRKRVTCWDAKRLSFWQVGL